MYLLATGARVNSDRGARWLHELIDWNLDDDRVRVKTRHRIPAGCRHQWDQMKRIEGPQSCKIENRSQVDEEWIVALARKDFDAPRQRMDCRGGKRIVIRRRSRPNVIGRSRQVCAENLLPRRFSV